MCVILMAFFEYINCAERMIHDTIIDKIFFRDCLIHMTQLFHTKDMLTMDTGAVPQKNI